MKKRNPLPFFLLIALLACCVFQNSACSSPPEKKCETTKDTLKNPSFLFLSDIHLNTFDSTTDYGGDTGLKLWKNFLAKADSVLAATNSPNFIVYTGDLCAHYKCIPSCYLAPDDRETHNANIAAILNGLRALADKYKKPLFYMPGNNDGLAGDYYSFADEKQQTPFSLVPEIQNPFPALNIIPGEKAPCMISNPHPTMGYYSARPVEGLRIIALNTVMFSSNFVIADNSTIETDRAEEMNWLAAELKDAKDKGEKVYIAMHIPPGTDAYSGNSMWTTQPLQNGSTLLNNFLVLTSKYQQTIAGILYGHTHMDEVRRLYDTTGTKITEVAICCPGVTPQHYNNPGFKVVSYQAENKELLNFTTFYTTPENAYWGNCSYTFNSTFAGTANKTIFETLSALPLAKANTYMSTMYTVQHGAPTYDISRGIEVKMGK